MAITNTDQLLISAQGQTCLLTYTTGGALVSGSSYSLMLNDEVYTLRDGDMASGCDTKSTDDGDCVKFTTFYVDHGTGISGSNLYRVSFAGTGPTATLKFETNVDFEAHIGFDAAYGAYGLVSCKCKRIVYEAL